MSLLVTGTIGIDSVATEDAKCDNALGGSAVYFSFAAMHYTDVRLVGVVGGDFPAEFRELLASREINLDGLEIREASKTFRWSARYERDMNERETLDTQLNVLMEEPPKVPESYADSKVVFLANSHPVLQRQMLSAVTKPKLVVCDTMNLWIDTAKDELIKTLGMVDGVIINDGEARDLTGHHNIIDAGHALLDLGSKFAVIKKGEHGAMLVTREGTTVVPAFPMRKVVDPTGAGDSFAGGMLGYLTAQETIDYQALRRSLVRGTVAASFTIEDFSLNRVKGLQKTEIDQRIQEFINLLRID